MDGQGRLGDYTPAAQFTKQYPLPEALSPLPGEVATTTPTYAWKPVFGAASYRLEVSLYPNMSEILESVTTNNTRYTPTRVYEVGRTYYWRVAMIDRDGRAGSAEIRSVLVNPTPLENPVYLPRVSAR